MKNISRRDALKGLGFLAGASLVGCGRDVSSSVEENNRAVSSVSETTSKPISGVWSRGPERKDNYVEEFGRFKAKFIWVPEKRVYWFWDRHFGREGFQDITPGFWMQETEMSIDQYLSLLEISNYDPRPDTSRRQGGMPHNIRNPDMPANSMSYKNIGQITDYLASRTRRGYRLPNILEWFAAVGSTLNKPFGDLSKETANISWGETDWASVEQVKARSPNKNGFYNLIGNIKEYLYLVDPVREYYSGDYVNRVDGRNVICFSPGALTREESFDLENGRGSIFELLRLGLNNTTTYSSYNGFRLVRDPNLDV